MNFFVRCYRRRLEAPDVLIFDDDEMNLTLTNSNDNIEGAVGGVVAVVGGAAAVGGGGDRKCGGCGSPRQHRNITTASRPARVPKRTLHPSPGWYTRINVTLLLQNRE